MKFLKDKAKLEFENFLSELENPDSDQKELLQRLNFFIAERGVLEKEDKVYNLCRSAMDGRNYGIVVELFEKTEGKYHLLCFEDILDDYAALQKELVASYIHRMEGLLSRAINSKQLRKDSDGHQEGVFEVDPETCFIEKGPRCSMESNLLRSYLKNNLFNPWEGERVVDLEEFKSTAAKIEAPIDEASCLSSDVFIGEGMDIVISQDLLLSNSSNRSLGLNKRKSKSHKHR